MISRHQNMYVYMEASKDGHCGIYWVELPNRPHDALVPTSMQDRCQESMLVFVTSPQTSDS